MKDKSYLIIVAAFLIIFISACKSTENTSSNEQRISINNTSGSLPPEFLEESTGLSSEEARQIYAYAQEKAALWCEKLGIEANTHIHNADQQKEKNNQLEQQIYDITQEIEEYLGNNSKRRKSFNEAFKIEKSNCKWNR